MRVWCSGIGVAISMPARHVRFVPRLPALSAEDAQLALVLASCKASTAAQYASARRVLAAFVAVLRACPPPDATAPAAVNAFVATLTQSEFVLFLAARKEQQCASAEVHRSALVQLQLGAGVEVFASSPAMIRATRAVGIAAGANKVDKGSITASMLLDMLGLQDETELATALAFGFAAELRVTELAFVLVGDLQQDNAQGLPDTDMLTLRIAKSRRAPGADCVEDRIR